MPETLSRKLGPLPVWGWIVVALAAFLVWRRRTEGGWFGAGSFETSPGGARVATSIGATFGAAYEDEGEGDGGSITPPPPLSLLGRDAQPPPITEPPVEEWGGGGGGTELFASSLSREMPGGPRMTRRERVEQIRARQRERVQEIKQGGVTPAERVRIQTIKARAQKRIENLRSGRR